MTLGVRWPFLCYARNLRKIYLVLSKYMKLVDTNMIYIPKECYYFDISTYQLGKKRVISKLRVSRKYVNLMVYLMMWI